jgi:O-glycosyl hydrolase
MLKKLHSVIVLSLLLAMSTNYLKAQVATIDLDDLKQPVRGFGGAHYPEWGTGLTVDQVDKVFGNNPGQIGLQILRLPVPTEKSSFSMQTAAAARAKLNSTILFASPWSPPPAMKTNKNVIQGKLDTAYYDDFANYLDSFSIYMASNNAPLYAISIQNEPDWLPTYASCEYTSDDFINFLSNYGSLITSTNIIAPESFQFRHSLSDPILNDSAAAAHLDIIGGHIYGGGLADYPLAREMGKEVWMTEHYVGSTNWTGDIETAKEIHDCMVANFNAYIYWTIRNQTGFLNEAGDILKRGYVISQFAKFIRPGYTRVGVSVSSASNIDITAYKNDTNVVVIAINRNSTPVDLTVTFQQVADYIFTKFTTSVSKNVLNEGTDTTTGSSFTTRLDAFSVNTFTTYPVNGGRYGNTAPVANAGAGQTVTDADNNGYESVTLDGSASGDTDGSVIIYTWSEAGKQIADGMKPVLNIETGVHNILLTITDSDGATATDSVVVTVNMASGIEEVHIWLEAECGTVGSLWNITKNTGASNGFYVTIRPGNNSTSSASENIADQVLYTFNATEEGKYTVWARCRVPTPDDDSYWVKMDNGVWVMWNNISGGSTFQWDYVRYGADNSYDLTQGSHTLTFAYREDGALLDKLYITNTGTVPTGIGDTASNICVLTIINQPEISRYETMIYPNPFIHQTMVEFTLTETEYVNLSIIDITGRIVANPVNRIMPAGKNSVTIDGSLFEEGIYLCRFKTNHYSETTQIMKY